MKVRELSGLALDLWACRALLAEFEGQKLTPEVIEQVKNRIGSYPFRPSTDWAAAGPIIQRERIAVYWDVDEWVALWRAEAGPAGTLHANGPTMVGPSALVAAMRCFVAAKFGDEVDHEDA
ncbi:phage protein NinX family protein [Burkholderia gladioli]|uniref:phage protein NinX family protein n=1 Tax=Burkholderia gladioli TaxID=28095 RepID=UPI000F520B23|nr:phage protein NinX family protein [Burkholderia gladioli]